MVTYHSVQYEEDDENIRIKQLEYMQLLREKTHEIVRAMYTQL